MKTGDGSITFKKTFCLLSICVLGCFTGADVNAQEISGNAIPRASAAVQTPMFSDAELDQMLAPIALYPDVLLTQTLIASTYPSEAIEAGKWLKANPNLRGKEAVEAASQTNWDDSIKSLAAFPEILVPMAEYPDWTAGLGNAFLSQQQQLMNRVQYLRQKAKEQGNLKTNEQVRVQTTGQAANQTIVIQPATTQTVYVPYYNPTVVYGNWWWPAYAPVYWNPWPYAGYATGYSSGFMWSGVGLWFSYTSYRPVYNWHRHRVYIVDRHDRRPGSHGKPVPHREWNHRPEHRHDVSYRDKTYKPGSNTQWAGQHGKPGQKPYGTQNSRPQARPDTRPMTGKNDRPSFDKDKRPGFSQTGGTDNRHNANRPDFLNGKTGHISGKDNSFANHNRPTAGQVNSAGQKMSGTHPVVNSTGQSAFANTSPDRTGLNGASGKPANIQRPANNQRPSNNQAADTLVNNGSGRNPSNVRTGYNRPMSIPPVNRPANNRPVSTQHVNNPVNNSPATSAVTNRPANNRPVQTPSNNRPTDKRSTNSRPSQRQDIGRPSGNQTSQARIANRPMANRSVPTSQAGRPAAQMRPAASGNRPSPSASRPVVNSRPVSTSSANSRPAGGGSNHAASAPSRSSPSHDSRSSGQDRGNNDRGRGR